MNKTSIITLAAIALVAAVSCKKLERTPSTEGILSFENFSVQWDAELVTKASAAPGDYRIFITNAAGTSVLETTYADVLAEGKKVSLPAGNYTLEARSTEDAVPTAAFDTPVYGASTDFTITAGQTTTLGNLTCTLLQVKATVSYDEGFLEMVTGPGKTTVTVNPSAPLEFPLEYTNGTVSYDQRAGYYAVNAGGNATMNIVFSGNISGKSQKMVANLTGVQAKQWRQIRFIKKTDGEGNASFAIEINTYVNDEELVVDLVAASETVIGPDPDAPVGDGGITLAFAEGCTMFNDLDNIVVPAGETGMDLRILVTVPGGVNKFTVEMASTSDAFLASVALAGGTTLDLISPAAEQDIIFQIVPFPHGSDLAGKTSLLFDLSAAQGPINAFPGRHTFTMKITDMNGCSNAVPVTLVVNK